MRCRPDTRSVAAIARYSEHGPASRLQVDVAPAPSDQSAAGWMRRDTLAAGKGHLIWRGRLQPQCGCDHCDRPTSQLSSWRQIEAGVDSAADLSRSRVCSIPARLYAASCSTPLTGLPSTFATGPRWSIQVSVTRHPVAVVWNS